MNPSFTGLPVTSATAVQLPSTDTNSITIQSDGAASGGFNQVFQQLSTTASPELASQSPESRELLAALQELPQGGKLLPLLEQTIDKVAAAGGDLKQLLAHLTAGLKQLAREPDSVTAGAPAAAQLAFILQPLVDEQPGLQGMLPAELSVAVQRQALQAGPAGDADRLPRDVALNLTQKARDAGVAPATADGSSARDSRAAGTGLDPAGLAQFQQQFAAPGAREQAPDMSALLSSLKRLMPDSGRAPGADTPVTPLATVHGASSAAPASAAAAASPAAVNTPLGQPGWDQDLGDQIQWLASQKMHSAQVKLNPASLGPMEVRIQVHNDQASVQFSAHHAVVRDALEAALPRLRDMFEASGVQLVNVDVSSGSFAGRQELADPGGMPKPASAGSTDMEQVPETVSQTTLARFISSGRLDLFA